MRQMRQALRSVPSVPDLCLIPKTRITRPLSPEREYYIILRATPQRENRKSSVCAAAWRGVRVCRAAQRPALSPTTIHQPRTTDHEPRTRRQALLSPDGFGSPAFGRAMSHPQSPNVASHHGVDDLRVGDALFEMASADFGENAFCVLAAFDCGGVVFPPIGRRGLRLLVRGFRRGLLRAEEFSCGKNGQTKIITSR